MVAVAVRTPCVRMVQLQRRVPEERDLIDLLQTGLALLQAPADRLRRPGPVVLLPGEALFERSADQGAVPQETGRGVETWR